MIAPLDVHSEHVVGWGRVPLFIPTFAHPNLQPWLCPWRRQQGFVDAAWCREPPDRPPSAPVGPPHARVAELPPEDMFQKERPRPPKFKTPMKPLTRLMENDPAHFECRLVPVGDPDMVVEWYKDGVLLKHGQ